MAVQADFSAHQPQSAFPVKTDQRPPMQTKHAVVLHDDGVVDQAHTLSLDLFVSICKYRLTDGRVATSPSPIGADQAPCPSAGRPPRCSYRASSLLAW